VTTLGELTASIAHEVNQPLAAIVTNAEAGLRWLAAEAPKVEEARRAVERIIRDAHRASAVIRRTRDLSKKSDLEMLSLDVNNVINEVLLLVQPEAASNRVALRLALASGLPAVHADRVQLQQVIINLVINGIEAMASPPVTTRELVIRSQRYDAGQVLVAVQDHGTGIDPENANQLFTAFFTTKPNGMGMGLSICRSIIEAHGGRVWAVRNIGPGTTFQFTLAGDTKI
jgi:signal transduction histidine kinase